MNESQMLAKAIRSLTLCEAAVKEAQNMVTSHGYAADMYGRYHSEWLNDIVVFLGEPLFAQVARDPNKHFVQWLGERLQKPYHVTFRAHDKVRARWGDEVAVELYKIKWEQEVAWAKKMRASDNDRIAFLAGIWLASAERDPYSRFQQIAQTYIEAREDGLYKESSYHMLTPRAIMDERTNDSHWIPLWLRSAEREFGSRANSLPKGKIVFSAQKARESQWKESRQTVQDSEVSHLKKWRPSLMIGTLTTAHNLGLNSDDILEAENNFINEVEQGKIDLANQPNPAWRVFQKYLEKYIEVAVPPSLEGETERWQKINNLSPNWIASLPQDFLNLGGGEEKKVVGWLQSLQQKQREVPADPVIDYGLWLIEHAVRYQADQ